MADPMAHTGRQRAREVRRSGESETETLRAFVCAPHPIPEERRAELFRAVRFAGMEPVELDPVALGDAPVVAEVLRLARSSDVLLGIVEWRYGWVPDGHERSLLEFAYDAAPERVMLVIDESTPIDPLRDLDDGPQRGVKFARLEAFKERMTRDGTLTRFHGDHLQDQAIDALSEWRLQREARLLSGGDSLDLDAVTPDDPELESDVQGYLRAAEAQHSTLHMAGFETLIRVPIELEDLYVPLHASIARPEDHRYGYHNAEEAEEALSRYGGCPEIPLTEAFLRTGGPEGKRGVTILGDPGSGKTTHLRRLLLWLVRLGPESLELAPGAIPVYLPLRNVEDARDGLRGLLERELATAPFAGLPRNFARRLLERGNLLFLLDGLDEIPGHEGRTAASRFIEQALEEHPTCRFVVTCRYAGYSRDVRLSSDFLELHLRPLGTEQAEQFIDNWFRIVETSLPGDRRLAEERAREQSQALVQRLEEPDFRARRVFELTRNPLLLTAICLVHRDRGRLPHRRCELYDECVNVLLERWREAKKLDVSVGAKNARRILQPVAHWLHSQQGRTRATGRELAPVIGPELRASDHRDKDPHRFLETIRDESGLLTGWSNDTYGFMHLGFQEYLTAREIRDRAFEDPLVLEELAAHFGDSWWREVGLLVLAFEDPPLFEPYMRALVRQPAFVRHADQLDECLDDACRIVPDPFVELLREGQEEQRGVFGQMKRLIKRDTAPDTELWSRQLVALRLLQRYAPHALEGLEATLRRHPCREIREQVGAGSVDLSADSDRTGYELVSVPGGTFLMGSPVDEVGHTDDEGPQHKVTLAAFRIGRYPVTNEQYETFLAENPHVEAPRYWGDRQYNQPHQPVVGVSWHDAKAFADWAGLQLPTEAQWEYACRAGSTTRYHAGDAEELLSGLGWYAANSEGRLHPVGQLAPNDWNLFDMHGNVDEWCRDGARAYLPGAETDPSGSLQRDSAAIRGGGWLNNPLHCRSASRRTARKSLRNLNLGFRLVAPE